MQKAILQANIAYKKKEVPVGSILIYKGKILEKAYNKVIKNNNPILHAEFIVITKTIKRTNKFLHGTELYITLEPCSMCTEIIFLSRIKTIIFGTHNNEKNINSINYYQNIQITGGILEKECSKILNCFFKNKRINNIL